VTQKQRVTDENKIKQDIYGNLKKVFDDPDLHVSVLNTLYY
jgi:hypothetical protein